jgi:hypothetical protein
MATPYRCSSAINAPTAAQTHLDQDQRNGERAQRSAGNTAWPLTKASSDSARYWPRARTWHAREGQDDELGDRDHARSLIAINRTAIEAL